MEPPSNYHRNPHSAGSDPFSSWQAESYPQSHGTGPGAYYMTQQNGQSPYVGGQLNFGGMGGILADPTVANAAFETGSNIVQGKVDDAKKLLGTDQLKTYFDVSDLSLSLSYTRWCKFG